MNCLLNEDTMLKDVLSSLVGSMKELAKNKKPQDNKYLGGSISNYAKNLIMTFPTMCDNSLQPSTASMISRANERNITAMLQLLFASISFQSDNGADVLSQIHKNINSNMSMDDYIDKLDDIASNPNKFIGLENAEIREAVEEMVRILKTVPQKSYPVNSLSERSLNEYTVYNYNNNCVVKEDIFYTDEEIKNMNPGDLEDAKLRQGLSSQRNRDTRDAMKAAQDIANREAEKNAKEYQSQLDLISKRLLDSDVKKANEMAPSLLIVNYNEINKTGDGNVAGQKSFVAGVKSRLISVDSSDIVERLSAKNKTKVSFLNLIRATTGEIRLIRDFILCIDQAKIDAKNAVKKGPAAKMWKVLENRSIKNVANKIKRKGNDASAITTLVINQETVNILKKEYDFDLEQIKNTRLILDAYNLMGIIICDESIEVAKFFYAGNDNYEQQAYSYLEKESHDNSYKKVINLIGKMNGR